MNNKLKYIIHREQLTKAQIDYLEKKLWNLDFYKSTLEGNFSQIVFNQEHSSIDDMLFKIISLISSSFSTDQNFNNITIKKFEKENYISQHIDSRNTVGESITIFLGNTSANYEFDKKSEVINSGDIVVQQCTNGYSMGPMYSMKPLEDGEMFSITLNTILKENPV